MRVRFTVIAVAKVPLPAPGPAVTRALATPSRVVAATVQSSGSASASLRRPALALALAVAALVAGCGTEPPDSPAGARLTITRDFGAREVRSLDAPHGRDRETVLRLLERNANVTTGDGSVQGIDGVAGGRRAGRPLDWFFYVNGIAASAGASATRLHPGDRVWWDRHDSGTARRVPAVVGSFPEPFVHGSEGKRLPVRVECADPEAPACDAVATALTDLGVPAARGGLRTSHTERTLRVVVGRWSAARTADTALQRMEHGPRASGVFARPTPDGRRIDLLDARGRRTRAMGRGGGLIVATKEGDVAPTWAVTGTDEDGVAAASRAFDENALRDRFALAVVDGRAVGLPEVAAR
jgi:hypothetical protein